MILWTKVCKDRGWKSGDKPFRLAKFGELVGRPLTSTYDVDRMDECTKLMKSLKAMLGVDMQAARESDDQMINRARVLRHKILTELVPCLELYVADVAGYMREIMEDKNRWWKIDRPTRGMTLMDLDAKPIIRRDKISGELKEFPSQLDQMVYTLSACLNGSGKPRAGKATRLGFRVAAGDTLHAMKTKAGVTCDCSICTSPSVAITYVADTTEAEHLEPEPF